MRGASGMGAGVAADILVMRTQPDQVRADRAASVKQALLPFEDELPELIDRLYYEVDRRTPSKDDWTFVMLSPDQNEYVVQYLLANSDRPMQAVAVWARCFRHLNRRTTEIMLTRDELAGGLGFPPDTVTRIMATLRECGAVSSKRVKVEGVRGRGMVRYFMNPNVGTHLKGEARRIAQEAVSPVAPPEPRQTNLHLVPA